MSTLRIRFTFNQQKGTRFVGQGGTKKFENFSRVLVQQLAFEYSDEYYDLLKTHIESQVKVDIQRELDNMARLFMLHVVGIAGRNRGPTGTLKTVSPKAGLMAGIPTQASLKSLAGDWPRRSPDYINWRLRHGGTDEWFHRQGHVLSALGSSKTWSAAFGGIAVSLSRHTKNSIRNLNLIQHNLPVGKKERTGIATLRVVAMNHITPGMLPALGGAGLGDYGSSPRKSGLLKMLGDPIAWRLGGNPITVPFRPTIQPFLGFFLTRAMPNAVARRIEQGFQKGRWTRKGVNENAGSAGRV
jgi:hypothetical protein